MCGIVALDVLPRIAVFTEHCIPVILVVLAEAPYRGGVFVGRCVLEGRRVAVCVGTRRRRVDGGRVRAMLEISRRIDRGDFCHNPVNET